MTNPGQLSHGTPLSQQVFPDAAQVRVQLGRMLQSVQKMMEANGQLGAAETFRDDILADPSHATRKLRRKMIAGNPGGEIGEYLDAEFANDHEEIMDGGLDGIIVLFGMLLTYYPLPCIIECAAEVERANNDKFNGKHGPTIFDGEGKMMKPEGWVGPQLKPILEKYGVPTDKFTDSFKMERDA